MPLYIHERFALMTGKGNLLCQELWILTLIES